MSRMIRDAVESDLPWLSQAMLRVHDAHVREYPTVYRKLEPASARSHLADLMAQPESRVRVAVHQNHIVGHLVFLTETRPETLFTLPRRYGYIAQIDVEPAYRRQGYGRSLIEDCLRSAASLRLTTIMLDVWAFNESARSFFRSLGFDELGYKMSRCVMD
ncbi:GNAT family N-acetyltransferase [Roseiconus nitratireducens]|uniref:GNAT family N-acetyltransferase n=1 Tax=Roseiconus nitratireducens TaxID=2605748 RepID=A0A5M6CRV6_9BACT|nr:GNAT family N-acetyltransferase [Roseiconus nitratireducens]KAA5537961.1 GNAT family N-acetyltransferase [Roseiconus nitratireducens]